ncbi:J domain-containing protein [Pseudomonas sp. McL0111]|uniref:J domain-containing protein n=1 Tax=Pseudomonas sp. McL0111 TaxID=3457357 RepID=UPI00403E4B41
MKWTNLDTGYKDQLDIIKRQTPHERLGIEVGATMDEVKKAYRKKVKLYHPDRADNFMENHATEVIKLLNQALEKIKQEHAS